MRGQVRVEDQAACQFPGLIFESEVFMAPGPGHEGLREGIDSCKFSPPKNSREICFSKMAWKGAVQRRSARGQLIRCMSAMVNKGGLKVDDKLVRLVERDIAPGTGVDPEHFWTAFGRLVLENAPRCDRGDAGRALCGNGVRAMLCAPAGE
jgi:hypothetical protein